MTDVRDGGGARGPRMRDEPGEDLDELLTRWGSEQSGPFRRPTLSGGRHAAPEPATPGDDQPPSHPAPPTPRPQQPRHAEPPAARAGARPSWPGEAAPGQREHPSWPSSGLPVGGPPAQVGSGTGRRYRPDGVPPAWDLHRGPGLQGPGHQGPGHQGPGLQGPGHQGPGHQGPGAAPDDRAGPPLAGPAVLHRAVPYARPAGHDATVGVLERVPDRHRLLTDDLDGYVRPAPDDDDRDDGTPGRHRRPGARPARTLRPRWLRTLRWVGLGLAALLLIGGAVVVHQYRKLSGNINRIDALAPGDAAIRDAAKQLDAQNYLLIGSDTRAGANGRYEDSAGQVTGERSDTTILAHLSPDRSKATLVSFPRDSWVSLPECRRPDGTVEPAHDGQFNEAFTIGGPSCTVLAVQKLTGIKINHYVQVDFTGFKTMVDAVGGVPICTTTPLRDKESGLRMEPGTTRLRGEQALAYVRARYGIGDGSDLGRIQRQQRFLGAMVRSATSTKLLVNPVALTRFLDAATKSLTLDRETSFGDLKALADQLDGLDPTKVAFLTAPIADAAYNPPGFPPLKPGQGGSKVLLDDAAGRVLWDSIINDEPAPPKGVPAPRPKPSVLTVAPEQVTVRVLNGVGTSGLGATVSTALAGAGFSLVEPTNAPPTPATTVRYGPAQAEQAKTLAAAVPGAVLQPDAGTTLDLVVGANYSGVKRVQPGDPSTAKTAVSPKPKPAATSAKPVTAADATCT